MSVNSLNFTLQHPHSKETPSDSVTNMTVVALYWVIWAVLNQMIVVFGIISNILNIICFSKQGFKESINVSLTGLAVSDLGCLLPIIWSNICFTPAFTDLDLPFVASEIQYIGALTHVVLTRISSWITATITLERCMCVAMPLKVKEIITPRRAFVIIMTIFLALLASSSPQYYYNKVGRKYFRDRNKTLIGLIHTKELSDFENISYPINFVFVQFLAFFIVIICTITLVVQLKLKSQWREKTVFSSNVPKLTSSNKKVAKMVVMISIVFIACFTINIVNCIVFAVVPEFNIHGKLRHVVTLFGGFGFFLESVNSSTNIFIYYHMSTRYRDVFRETFLITTHASAIVKSEMKTERYM